MVVIPKVSFLEIFNSKKVFKDSYGMQYGGNYMGGVNSYSPSQISPTSYNRNAEELLAISVSVWTQKNSFL